jgi:uncharacterized RDD family membrane protein YckC
MGEMQPKLSELPDDVGPAPTGSPGFGRRLLALLVDYALIVGYLAVLVLAALLLVRITGTFMDWLAFGTVVAELLGFVLLVLPVGIYLYAGEASARQATVGKRVLGLRVVLQASGGRPGRARILVRTVVKLIPWEFAHFFVWQAAASAGLAVFPRWIAIGITVANLLPIAYLVCVLLQRDKRGPHDLVAGTRVIVAPR